jgi:hypothetical protein
MIYVRIEKMCDWKHWLVLAEKIKNRERDDIGF